MAFVLLKVRLCSSRNRNYFLIYWMNNFGQDVKEGVSTKTHLLELVHPSDHHIIRYSYHIQLNSPLFTLCLLQSKWSEVTLQKPRLSHLALEEK